MLAPYKLKKGTPILYKIIKRKVAPYISKNKLNYYPKIWPKLLFLFK